MVIVSWVTFTQLTFKGEAPARFFSNLSFNKKPLLQNYCALCHA